MKIKVESFTTPITEEVLQKKDFGYPSGGIVVSGGIGGNGSSLNTFNFYNGIYYVNFFKGEDISGDILHGDVSWEGTFNLPPELLSRKIMAFYQISSKITGDFSEADISFDAVLNDVIMTGRSIGEATKILVPVNPLENNDMKINFHNERIIGNSCILKFSFEIFILLI